MVKLESKTARMLEVEKQFGVELEELMRVLRVDYKKSNAQIAEIIGVTTPTIGQWFEQIDVTSKAKNMPSETNENGVDIPFYDEESYLVLLNKAELTVEQADIGIELGFGDGAWTLIRIPEKYNALRQKYFDAFNASKKKLAESNQVIPGNLNVMHANHEYASLDHTGDTRTRELSPELQRLLTPDEIETFIQTRNRMHTLKQLEQNMRDFDEDSEMRAAMARYDDDDEIEHCIS
jgi:lambda repressor-like predicted transcriptional regulator